jgi:hypothetical protein
MTLRVRARAGLYALLCGLLPVFGGPAAAHAQAALGASVTVLVVPTSGAGVRPLDFGTVPMGATTSRTIAAFADSSATGIAHFNFTGVTGNRDVQLTFDFPSVLTHPGSGSTMPVSFDGSHGLYCFNRNSGIHACTLFNPSPGGADPSVIVITPPAPPRNGTLRVYLGGAASPSLSQTAGTYQGVITLTMVRI